MSQRPVHYINGEWVNSPGTVIASVNPATNDVVWEGPSAEEAEIEHAIKAARDAFPKWTNLSLDERIAPLHQFREELALDKEKLALAISKETGKPIWESKGEVEAMRNKIGISIDAYQKRCGETIHSSSNTTSVTRHRAHGVVAVFGPYNFPGHLPNGHIIPALLAGNAIVFKPSEHTPLTAEVMMRCWEKVNLPQGVLNMVQGGRETGRLLSQNRNIDGLFFTGSWLTGQHFLQHFAQHPGKILALEMGGNNPLIIWDAKNLAASAYLTIQSAFLTSGQRCTCARRLIIDKDDDGDKLLQELKTMISKIKIGKYTDKPEPFMGPVISREAALHLLKAQDFLLASGGKSILKMEHLSIQTGFVSPGVIDVTNITNRPDEEYFGPLLQVIRVNSFEEALVEADNTEYGLAAGLISSNPKLYEKFRSTVRAGIINWNSPLTGASSAAPFGGIGKSGNYRPSAFYAADYCAYPVASMENTKISFPETIAPGINIQRQL